MTVYKTHGPNAEETVELDFELGAFLFTGTGSVVPGTIDGSGVFTVSGGTNQPVYRLDRALRELDCLAGLLGLVDMQREAHLDIFCTADAACTTSAIKVKETLANASAGCGKWLAIGDELAGQPRPLYLVDSITGTNTINLAAPMSQAAPLEGAPLCLKAARKPRPNPAHFTLPAIGFKVGSQWCVLEQASRTIYAATLSGSLLDKYAGAPVTVAQVWGGAEGNASILLYNQVRGRWDAGTLAQALTVAAQWQLRRGSKAEVEAYKGAVGEVVYDTDRKVIVAMDGSSDGGEPAGKLDQFSGTEHATGAYRGALPVYEKSFTATLTLDAGGNCLALVAHGIPSFDPSLQLVSHEASFKLNGIVSPVTGGPVVALGHSKFNLIGGSSTGILIDGTYIYLIAELWVVPGVTSLTAKVRLVYAR